MKRLLPIVVLVLALAGCAAGAPPEAEPTEHVAVVEISAADITDIDSGIEWARGLDDTVDADELSQGITAIGDLVPELDIWFATNNEIGQALISLNSDVLDAPADAGTKVDDLNAIVDDIEAAIEHGPNP